jgi:transcriptional regulator with XRE-family HTH domain
MSQPFGQRLRQERQKRGWTLKELSRRSGVSVSHISSLERGVRMKPSVEAAKRLADALALPLEFFLEDPSASMRAATLSDPSALAHLPEEIRTFILNENAAPYLALAKKLSDKTLSESEMVSTIRSFIQAVRSSKTQD